MSGIESTTWGDVAWCAYCGHSPTLVRQPIQEGYVRRYVHVIKCDNKDCTAQPRVERESIDATLTEWNGRMARGGYAVS